MLIAFFSQAGMGDSCESNSSSNPKQKCVTAIYHPDTNSCSLCIIWKQSKNETKLLQFHPLRIADSMQNHAGMNFELEIGDCTCVPWIMKKHNNDENEEAEELEGDFLLQVTSGKLCDEDYYLAENRLTIQ